MTADQTPRNRRFAGSSRVPDLDEFLPEEFGLPVVPRSVDEISEKYSVGDMEEALQPEPPAGSRIILRVPFTPSTRSYPGQSFLRTIVTVLEASSGYQNPFFVDPFLSKSSALTGIETTAVPESRKTAPANRGQLMKQCHDLVFRWATASISEYDLLSAQTRAFLSTYQNAGWDCLQTEISVYEAEPDRLEPLFSFLADFAGEINSPAAQSFFAGFLENARPAWRYLAAIVLNRIGHEWASMVAKRRLAKEKNMAVKAALQTAC